MNALTVSEGPAQRTASQSWAPYIVIATRGRARATATLFTELQKQTLPVRMALAIGADKKDIENLENHPLVQAGCAMAITAPIGSTFQRNAGLEFLKQRGAFDNGDSFVVFFDDDFRPAPTWLERCAAAFSSQPNLAGLTGRVLADGAVKAAVSEYVAQQYISAALPPTRHFTNRPAGTDLDCLYGCNMAVRGDVARAVRFDEGLPLYGWQEDRDYTGQSKAFGRIIAWPECTGVHLGVKSGRTSGLRFGYSQIANPQHIARRGNMGWPLALGMMAKALASNSYKGLRGVAFHDYPGRFKGNLLALQDLARGRCDPARILSM